MIKFITYSGAWPNLCRGKLVLEIDEKIVIFGDGPDETDYPSFWKSGGTVSRYFDNRISPEFTKGEWVLDEDRLPDKFKNIANELIDIFNDNVEYGCCGGCI